MSTCVDLAAAELPEMPTDSPAELNELTESWLSLVLGNFDEVWLEVTGGRATGGFVATVVKNW